MGLFWTQKKVDHLKVSISLCKKRFLSHAVALSLCHFLFRSTYFLVGFLNVLYALNVEQYFGRDKYVSPWLAGWLVFYSLLFFSHFFLITNAPARSHTQACTWDVELFHSKFFYAVRIEKEQNNNDDEKQREKKSHETVHIFARANLSAMSIRACVSVMERTLLNSRSLPM